MKSMIKFWPVLIYCILIAACSAPQNETTQSLPKSQTKIEEDFKLPLDSETSLYNRLNSKGKIGDKEVYLLFNQNSNTLQVYDLDSKSMDQKITFNWDGPNSLQGLMYPFGFHYVNSDSLIFYSGMFKTIYLANINGEVYKKISLANHPIGFGSVLPKSPIAYRNGFVYMQSLPVYPPTIPEDYVHPPNRISKISLKNGEMEEFELDYPEIYKNRKISQQLKMLDIVYNPKLDKFIVSFPLSDKLYVTDFKSNPEVYGAKSDLVKNPIETDKNNTLVEQSALSNFYFWMNSSYEKILYDIENDIYIREVRAGLSEQDYLNRKFKSKRELILLNSDFQEIDRIPYESAEMYYSFFRKGSFFWNKNIQEFNLEAGIEDTLFFNSIDLVYK